MPKFLKAVAASATTACVAKFFPPKNNFHEISYTHNYPPYRNFFMWKIFRILLTREGEGGIMLKMSWKEIYNDRVHRLLRSR